jgi:hypothetical protein
MDQQKNMIGKYAAFLDEDMNMPNFFEATNESLYELFGMVSSIVEEQPFVFEPTPDSATNKRFGNRELWKRVASRLVLQGRTVLVAHIVLGEMKIVNVNAFFRHLQAI